MHAAVQETPLKTSKDPQWGQWHYHDLLQHPSGMTLKQRKEVCEKSSSPEPAWQQVQLDPAMSYRAQYRFHLHSKTQSFHIRGPACSPG